MEVLKTLVFICPMLFIAGVIDGAVGGGGLIALPAYMLTGMPMHYAYGCNKLQSFLGTSVSAVRYIKNGLVDFRIAGVTSLLTVLGSFIATKLVLMLNDNAIKTIVLIFLPVIVALMFIKRRIKNGDLIKNELNVKTVLICMAIGLVLGFYDGLFGPGGGTVAMILFAAFLNYDMRIAGGNGKIIIVVSNFIALLSYIIKGTIFYQIAIPAAIANILGSYIGAGLAIRKGTKIIMPFMILVIVILFAEIILSFFGIGTL